MSTFLDFQKPTEKKLLEVEVYSTGLIVTKDKTALS